MGNLIKKLMGDQCANLSHKLDEDTPSLSSGTLNG